MLCSRMVVCGACRRETVHSSRFLAECTVDSECGRRSSAADERYIRMVCLTHTLRLPAFGVFMSSTSAGSVAFVRVKLCDCGNPAARDDCGVQCFRSPLCSTFDPTLTRAQVGGSTQSSFSRWFYFLAEERSHAQWRRSELKE